MRRTLIAGALVALAACSPSAGQGAGQGAGASDGAGSTKSDLPPAELAAGTKVTATFDDQIHSRRNKAGETVTATVAANVSDEQGRVVIAQGSTITFRIQAIHESERKSDQGVLRLAVEQLAMDGRTTPLTASVVSLERQLVGRKTNAGDAAKVGAGVGIGAVGGGLVGGTKGAIIGGALGGAVGTQRAIETKDRDVYVAKGSKVVIALKQKMLASK
jgi:hypothetical protein